MAGDAVQDRGHAVLADAPVEVAAAVGAGLDAAVLLLQRAGRLPPRSAEPPTSSGTAGASACSTMPPAARVASAPSSGVNVGRASSQSSGSVPACGPLELGGELGLGGAVAPRTARTSPPPAPAPRAPVASARGRPRGRGTARPRASRRTRLVRRTSSSPSGSPCASPCSACAARRARCASAGSRWSAAGRRRRSRTAAAQVVERPRVVDPQHVPAVAAVALRRRPR